MLTLMVRAALPGTLCPTNVRQARYFVPHKRAPRLILVRGLNRLGASAAGAASYSLCARQATRFVRGKLLAACGHRLSWCGGSFVFAQVEHGHDGLRIELGDDDGDQNQDAADALA